LKINNSNIYLDINQQNKSKNISKIKKWKYFLLSKKVLNYYIGKYYTNWL
jgi:hypothetical protein